MNQPEVYKASNNIRIITATSLFDGHDATINIIRRIIQSTGGEVIHLGHNKSVEEIVNCAIQEDAQAIAITSYQGGHLEFYKYMYDLLHEKGCGHIKIFGGGGGVILPDENEELKKYGIAGIYSPDDGRKMGLQGMINDLVQKSDYSLGLKDINLKKVKAKDQYEIASLISKAENYPDKAKDYLDTIKKDIVDSKTPIIGITGTGGAGKSSIVDEIIRRFLDLYPDFNIGIVSVDPSKRKSGGALLGDRIRMNSINHTNIYMRSLATRQENLALSAYVKDAVDILKYADFDLILLESSGIGQSDTEIIDQSDVYFYVMTPDYGAASQLEKIAMLDYADIIALNKFDKQGALDALRDVKKQYQRNNMLFETPVDDMPVFGTIASQYNNEGVNILFDKLNIIISTKTGFNFPKTNKTLRISHNEEQVIPTGRTRYLSEISDSIRDYNQYVESQAKIANRWQALVTSEKELGNDKGFSKQIKDKITSLKDELGTNNVRLIEEWESKKKKYKDEFYTYEVRGKSIKVETHFKSLSHSKIAKIALPSYTSWGDILKWNLKDNVPGEFPYAAGVFPFKRESEDPTRMFAGEGGPERTNKRFHYLSKGQKAKRLSTAFDSVTLYGADPDIRPDILGKIGNSGVSIACLDDAKKLYSGFDLLDSSTSVSMTINGPAPLMVGYFMNAAIDQACEKYIFENGLEEKVKKQIEKIYKEKGINLPKYQGDLPDTNNGLGLFLLGITGDQVLPADIYKKIKDNTLHKVRGTIQADILKEDQAQNTCIFSTDFALKMMGDIQKYFIDKEVMNFYSVSISGYHIAEAGANPITQLAFTLANGFTFVEYYLSRGMKIDDFAPNLSFFFSNGLDPEYSVIGRVARIIWAKAMKNKYKANALSQKLKYHIQTSGRSLHSQEIEFNDIRTTLQALSGIYDNCNSLHTNAYDEAITTPTEESVRRAIAIQMIINHEFGLAKNQNPLQGSFIIDELTELVEEAVMVEFDRLTERGGVLGAMESMYQRGKIQDESLYYESLKHSGELPIMGVNTFLSSKGSPTIVPKEVIRSNDEEKNYQIENLKNLHKVNENISQNILNDLKKAVLDNQNTFEYLMEATKYCSIGQITKALYEVGGEYRRNM
ncbi:MAG: methylmalonyl-CoA mutase family protein [Bacteroidales bacterium]|jgi:methylmalonyl-CoA mutase|nr:methylmalonyl-CoA mutase family protein [Bacteroidales bacterium]